MLGLYSTSRYFLLSHVSCAREFQRLPHACRAASPSCEILASLHILAHLLPYYLLHTSLRSVCRVEGLKRRQPAANVISQNRLAYACLAELGVGGATIATSE